MTSDAYRQGRIDGMREAAEAVAEMLAEVERRLLLAEARDRRRGWRQTRDARRVRLSAYRQAERRIVTRMKRLTPPREAGAITAKLERLGL